MLRRMPRRYSMDSRQEETAARRRRLLDAAILVLGEVGADRLTMEAVAERADAATRTLYNHFSSRDELIAAALGLLLQEAHDSLYLDTPAEGDPRSDCGCSCALSTAYSAGRAIH